MSIQKPSFRGIRYVLVLLGVCLLHPISPLHAQHVFNEHFAPETGQSTIVMSTQAAENGNFGVLGHHSVSGGNQVIFLTKTGPGGAIIWHKTYDVAGEDLEATALLPTDDNGFLIAADYDSPAFVLIRVKSDGSIDWSKEYENSSYGNFKALDLCRTPSGDFGVAGQSTYNGPAGLEFDVMTAVVASDGTLKNLGVMINSADVDLGVSIDYDGQGNFLVGVKETDTGLQDDFGVLSYDESTMSVNFYTRYRTGGEDRTAEVIADDRDGSFLIWGTKDSNTPVAIRATAAGAVAASFSYTEAGVNHRAVSAHFDADYEWALMTQQTSSHTHNNLIKTDIGGGLVFVKDYEGISNYTCSRRFDYTDDGGYVFATEYSSDDVALIKTDYNGYARCNTQDPTFTRTNVTISTSTIEPELSGPGNATDVAVDVSTPSRTMTVTCCGAGLCENPNGLINSRFEQIYGNEMDQGGYGLITQPNEGFGAAGTYNRTTGTGQNIYLLGLDNTGYVCWDKEYDLGGLEFTTDLATNGADATCESWYFGGYTTNGSDLFIGSTDALGNSQWFKKYSSPSTNDLAYISDVDVDYAFYARSNGFVDMGATLGEEGLAMAHLPNGTLTFEMHYGAAGSNERFYGTDYNVFETYHAGYTDAFDGTKGQEVFAVGATGGTLNYSVAFGTNEDDIAHDVAVEYVSASAANVYITGRTWNAAGDWDVFLAQTDKNGGLNWFRIYRAAGDDVAYAIAPDFDNSRVYLMGYSESGDATKGRQGLIMEVTTAGALSNAYVYGDNGTEVFQDGALDPFGRPTALGISDSKTSGDDDLLLVKTQALETECEQVLAMTTSSPTVLQATFGSQADPNMVEVSNFPVQLIPNSERDPLCTKSGSGGPGGGGGGEKTSPVEQSRYGSFEVFPNPTSDQFTLRYEFEDAGNSLVVYDLNGRKVIEGALEGISGQLDVATDGLEAGIYLLRIFHADGSSEAHKLSIAR